MNSILCQEFCQIVIVIDFFYSVEHLNAALLHRSPEPVGFLQIGLDIDAWIFQKESGPQRQKFSGMCIEIAPVKGIAPFDGICTAGIVEIGNLVRIDIWAEEFLLLIGDAAACCHNSTDLLNRDAEGLRGIVMDIIVLHNYRSGCIDQQNCNGCDQDLAAGDSAEKKNEKTGCYNVDAIAAQHTEQNRCSEKIEIEHPIRFSVCGEDVGMVPLCSTAGTLTDQK